VSPGAARAELEALLRAALAAVHGERLVRAAVREAGGALALAGRRLPPRARLVAAAAGKAAAQMAAGLEAAAGARVSRGWLVTRDGHARDVQAAGALPPARWTVREAGHPVPDARSEAAARELLALAAETRPEDVFVVLLSGGASALLACPQPGLALADLAGATRALLASGAAIDEVNAVRKHLVEVAGGRLARAARAARIEVLAISDVPGDRFDVIGSGPCTPDPSTFADALAVLARRGVGGAFPAAARAHLEAGARGERPESPKPGDPALARVHATRLAGNDTALAAAAEEARRRGLAVVPLPGALRGEAREAGRRLAALAGALRPSVPTVLIAGGETTVTLRGSGRGGRSQELALAAALALAGVPGVALLAAGTDGSDGPTDAAGACVDGDTVARASARGLDARAALAAHDSHSFFSGAGGVLRTGPTGTNVMDLVLLRVEPGAPVARPAGGGQGAGRANLPIPPASESV
jgi:glycerate 2-kinase